jgi:hypothetical protein
VLGAAGQRTRFCIGLHGSTAQRGCENHWQFLPHGQRTAAFGVGSDIVRLRLHAVRCSCFGHGYRSPKNVWVGTIGGGCRPAHKAEEKLQACVIFSARDHVSQKKPNDQEHDYNQGDGEMGTVPMM